jgi:Zn-dependent protease with chaperone function
LDSIEKLRENSFAARKMKIIVLIICLLIAPAVFCMLSGLLRFRVRDYDKPSLVKKRWKHLRTSSRLLTISWIVYGITIWSTMSSNMFLHAVRFDELGSMAATFYFVIRFLKSVGLGLAAFVPLALAYLAYLLAWAWSEKRIRQDEFHLGGAVRLMLFEALLFLLPYALLFLFVVSGGTPWVIEKRIVVQFNAPIALFVLASCSFVYFRSFEIARALTKPVVLMNDVLLEQRIAELSAMGSVKPGKLFRLKTFGYPYAQAYAFSNNDICLTDYVIDNFPATERDAVIAHELGHLQHIRILATKRFSVYAVFVFAFLFLFPLCDVFVADSLVNFLSKFALIYGSYLLLILGNKSMREYEHQADRFAVSTVGGEAFIHAMEKLHEVNLIPRRFNEKEEEYLSHPSLDVRTATALESQNRIDDR